MNSDKARNVRQKGHDDAKEFAHLLGLDDDYQNNPQAKKDVIDPCGDAHSVKSGQKKWQIFLYSASRFQQDTIFKRLNGLGQLLLDALDVFPDTFEEYKANKEKYKYLLAPRMEALKNRLQNPETLKAFFDKSFFNAAEVEFLTIKHGGKFHVFHRDDVLRILTNNITVVNSKRRRGGEFDNQKVVFKIPHPDKKNKLVTIGEIEIRKDSKIHYKEMKFWMEKEKTFDLLFSSIDEKKPLGENIPVYIYGKAIKKFLKCKSKNR